MVNEPMTVEELIARLNIIRDKTQKVVVRVQTMEPSIGSLPTVSVTGVHAGFDWDRGKIFIGLSESVSVAGETYKAEQKRARQASEALAFVHMAATNKSCSPEDRLRAVQVTLKARGFNRALDSLEKEEADGE